MLKEEFSEKIKEYMNKINIEISDKQIEKFFLLFLNSFYVLEYFFSGIHLNQKCSQCFRWLPKVR